MKVSVTTRSSLIGHTAWTTSPPSSSSVSSSLKWGHHHLSGSSWECDECAGVQCLDPQLRWAL